MTTTTVQKTEIAKEVKFAKLSIGELTPSKFKKGINQLELSQIVTTTSKYPSKKLNNDLFNDLLPSSDYSNESKRMFWLEVPEGVSKAQIIDKLANFPNARIVRHLYNDINNALNSQQEWAIANGTISLKEIADSQSVKDENGEVVRDKTYNRVLFRRYELDLTGNQEDTTTLEPSSQLDGTIF